MPRPSSIDQMPEEVRAEIGRLRMKGATIDQILAHLRALHPEETPSRSALGRHIQGLDKISERVRRSRDVATALVRELGDAPESTAARVNIELLHNVVLDLFMASEDGSEEVAELGRAALSGNPEGVMQLAKALDHLTHASKTNVDFIAAAEKRAMERARREAAAAVELVGRARGLTAETVEQIKAGIFGVQT